MLSVSVVMPLYNDAETLLRAVESAACQAFLREIIIVDDCSTDHSLALARELCLKLPCIRVFQTASNSGAAAARNLGVREASGELISFLDADDEFFPEYFAEVVPLFAENTTIKAIKVGMEFFDPVKGYILPMFDPRYPSAVFSSPCNVMIRRAAFELMGGFPEDVVFRGPYGGEDVAFCKALAEHLGPLGRIDTIYYRCWSYAKSHVDKFLAGTRLADNSDGFEFVGLDPTMTQGDEIEQAISHYMDSVKARLGGQGSTDTLLN